MQYILAIILSLFLMASPGTADSVNSGLAVFEFGDAAKVFVAESQPVSQSDFVSMMEFAALTGVDSLSFTYDFGIDKNDLSEIVKAAYQDFSRKAPEYSMYISLSKFDFARSGDKLCLTLYFNNRDGVNAEMLRMAMQDARQVYADLYQTGKLKSGMTETQRARIILQWVCEHMLYKDSGDMLAKTAYCGFENGYGVCGAYTGMYNSLLKLDGITCYARYGRCNDTAHTWTVALLDGQLCNIDAVGCDAGSVMTDSYFAKSDAEMRVTHSWN